MKDINPNNGKDKEVLISLEAEKKFNEGFPSFEEMIEGAKSRFSLPKDAWADFDAVIKKRADHKGGQRKPRKIKKYLKSSSFFSELACLYYIIFL